MSPKWQSFVSEFIKQLQVYLFAVVYLGLFRLVLIAWFHNKLDTGTGPGDVFLAIAHGFRFDSSVAAYFLLMPFLANILLSPFDLTYLSAYLRRGFSVFMLVFMTLTFVTTIPYFKEYDSQYDHWLFEALYDDRTAILRTMIEGYALFGSLLIVIVLSTLCLFLMRLWLKLPFTPLLGILAKPGSLFSRAVIILLILILTLAAARGGFKSRPVMRKWADVTTDIFLNKTVMNPIKHLQYAYRDFRSINSGKEGIRQLLGDMPVKTAAKEYFSIDLPDDQAGDLSNYLLRAAGGGSAGMPDHIFIIVMESFDSWPLLPKYQTLGIAERLRTLGENGVLFNHFLPSATGTMGSLSAILAGIPYTGVNISRIAANKPPFITSSASIFERLGYTTRLYYGGFLSWQNLGNLSRAQGIDQVFAAPSVEEEVPDGIWGAEDEQLFGFVAENTSGDEKTFNIIMTTSYHPPFSLDVKSKGFLLDEIPADIEPYWDGSMTINQLGHVWYGDQEVGKFVDAMEKAYPASLFAITGDHYGRRFLNARPSIYEHTSVPFILYGKQFLAPQGSANPTPGSHIDIVPTIVELIAPAGFQYHSFGRSMLARGEEDSPSATSRFGIGHQTIVTENFIANLLLARSPAPLPDASFVDDSDLFRSMVRKHNQLLGLGWWFIFKGEILEAAAGPE